MDKLKKHFNLTGEYRKDAKFIVQNTKGMRGLGVINSLINIVAFALLLDPGYETLLLFNRWVQSHGHLIIEPDWTKVTVTLIGLFIWFIAHTYCTRTFYELTTGYRYTLPTLVWMYMKKIIWTTPSIILSIGLGFISPIFYVLPVIMIGILSYYQLRALQLGSFRKAFRSLPITTLQLFMFGEFLNLMTLNIYGIYLKPIKVAYQYVVTKKESR